jgi:acetoin utilization protein AcuB
MSTIAIHPVRQFPTVGQFMTPSPVTIASNRSLAAARRVMLENHVRHLPVLRGGRIVGLLSERDLLLVESLPGVNPTAVKVEEAMVENVFAVPADAPIAEVVETMVERKLGSAVIADGEHVVGVFTTIDAMAALHQLLEQQS